MIPAALLTVVASVAVIFVAVMALIYGAVFWRDR